MMGGTEARRLSRVMVLALVLPMAVLLTGCDKTPTGRSQLALVPDEWLDDMGRQAFEDMRSQYTVEHGSAANQTVSCVSEAILGAAGKVYPKALEAGDWEVVVFDDPSPNAFALPGGRIGVNTGMLQLAETPDQLAAVIGHEVGHVLARHGNERMTQDLGIKAGLLLFGLLSEGEMNGRWMQALGLGAQLGIALPFSRTHEEEADLMGLMIMAEAGFNPAQSVELWRGMARAGGNQPPELLSTHPAHESRIKALQDNMLSARERYPSDAPQRCAKD